MPGLIVKAGIADQILTLQALGGEIMDRVSRHRPYQLGQANDGHMRSAIPEHGGRKPAPTAITSAAWSGTGPPSCWSQARNLWWNHFSILWPGRKGFPRFRKWSIACAPVHPVTFIAKWWKR